jgi:hypothetical protein
MDGDSMAAYILPNLSMKQLQEFSLLLQASSFYPMRFQPRKSNSYMTVLKENSKLLYLRGML